MFSSTEHAKGAVAEILCAKLFIITLILILLIIIIFIICQLWSSESPNFISHHHWNTAAGPKSAMQKWEEKQNSVVTLMVLEDWHFTWETVAVWFIFAIKA